MITSVISSDKVEAKRNVNWNEGAYACAIRQDKVEAKWNVNACSLLYTLEPLDR